MVWALGMNLEGLSYATLITWFFLYAGHLDVRLDFGFLTPIFVGPLYHRVHHGRSLAQQGSNCAFPASPFGRARARPTRSRG